jgi:hypothetical protein
LAFFFPVHLGKIDALVSLELSYKEVDHAIIEIFAAEEGVTVRGLHLEYT